MENLKTVRALLACAILALLIGAGCSNGGDQATGFTPLAAEQAAVEETYPVPGYSSGVVPWDTPEGVVPISVAPQPEIAAGSVKLVSAVGGIPFVEPGSSGVGRSTSALADGSQAYFSEFVSVSEVQGMTFSPREDQPAYACYELAMDQDGPSTVGFAWYSLPEQMKDYFVGIGDQRSGMWHWYAGPDDGILTFDPGLWTTSPEPSDTLLVCVALNTGKPADFWQLKAGVDETRGTGLAEINFDEYAALPVWRYAGKAASAIEEPPLKVDLTEHAPPIADQGAMGSCTAFACNDAAMNIQLQLAYGEYGWDNSNPAFRTSPMHSYVVSGVLPIGNWNPPCGANVGRYISEAFLALIHMGTATAATVPYVATENCSTTFPAKATEEAALLKAQNWYRPSYSGDSHSQLVSVITEMRLALADGQPIILTMRGLESSFLNYSGGVYHYGGTYGINAGHAMCIVGYDHELQAFKVRNSWGANWGLGGYWWCGYDAVLALIPELRMSINVMDVPFNPEAVTYFIGEDPQPDPEPEPEGDFDEIEPNGTTGTAGSLPEFNFSGYTGAVGYDGDTCDMFRFSYTDGDETEFALVQDGIAGVSFSLVDSNGTVISSGEKSFTTHIINGRWSGSGTAYLKIAVSDGACSYNLSGLRRHLPQAPTSIRATDGTSVSDVIITWSAVDGATAYIVERAGDRLGTYSAIGQSISTEFTDLETMSWETYWYRVKAVNAGGTSGPSAADSGYRAVPSPAAVMASNNTFPDRIEISWMPVDGADGYVILRGPANNGPFTRIGHAEASPVMDTGVVNGAIYYYTVAATKGSITGPAGPTDWGSAGVFDTADQDTLVITPDGSETDHEIRPADNVGDDQGLTPVVVDNNGQTVIVN